LQVETKAGAGIAAQEVAGEVNIEGNGTEQQDADEDANGRVLTQLCFLAFKPCGVNMKSRP